ncbi:hypothetical protein EZV62_008222 [Acer yangbiense]|uniref:Uncharacterized protein n=1 Tax=Acer yangbiense TaxID=1000413 RepID=A0A5C7ICJ5_9ROSI|nr:hypothetical protein EZV62_008222 [Acer yangbiense]
MILLNWYADSGATNHVKAEMNNLTIMKANVLLFSSVCFCCKEGERIVCVDCCLRSFAGHLHVVAGQGFIGWWMMKSGLEPRVSPYHLAAHLTSAFVIYSGFFSIGLSVVMPEPPAESVTWVRGAAKVKKLAIPVTFLVGITMDFNMNVNACVPTAAQYSLMVRAFILVFELS